MKSKKQKFSSLKIDFRWKPSQMANTMLHQLNSRIVELKATKEKKEDLLETFRNQSKQSTIDTEVLHSYIAEKEQEIDDIANDIANNTALIYTINQLEHSNVSGDRNSVNSFSGSSLTGSLSDATTSESHSALDCLFADREFNWVSRTEPSLCFDD